MNDCSFAEISVVLVTPDRYDTIHKTMHHLRQQTVEIGWRCDRRAVGKRSPVKSIGAQRVLPIARLLKWAEVNSVGRAWASGVREASAPVVATW